MGMGLDRILNDDAGDVLEVSFTDPDGAPAVPATITYRIDCVTTGAELVADTPISAAETVEIELPASSSAIQDPANPIELKRVTVVATYGTGRQKTKRFEWVVENQEAD